MLNNICNVKKENIVSISYFNSLFSTEAGKLDIDYIRADIEEIAYIIGENDYKKITSDDVIFFIKNYRNDIPLIVDVPLSLIYHGKDVNLSGVIDYYIKSNANHLCFDLMQTEIIKKTTSEDISVFGFSKNKNDSFEKIKDFCIEFESAGGEMLFLEKYPAEFVDNIASLLNIPVVADVKSKTKNKYIKVIDLLGFGDLSKKLLNFKEIFTDTVKEYIFESKKT